ncbi:hypothetical protein BBJ28_00008695 [Nothophytophthora sp. Chile5]|nr:hypothetical protein BBJ28_00008695 [Nothophytophthora sp. Chile5]
MESLFVRSLALGAPAQEAQSLASASRTTADGTFAVASAREGVIRVYAASCSALLHEFASIHGHIYALHYTSFSDSLVTLESDVAAGEDGDHGDDDGDAETFLCVYHDWRERKMVRGYTLPLGVLESPSSNRKADCVAVCSFTGRVVVAMGTVINIWQCSRGFFEHVMELKVDMAQRHAFLQVEYVAIHGVYVAFASQTEVRVMEIHVRSSNDVEEAPVSLHAPRLDSTPAKTDVDNEDGAFVPEDSAHCVKVSSLSDLDAFIEVPVSCSAYSTMESETRGREQDERRIFEEQEQTPMVLGRNEAQQEVWNLAGLVKSQDIRTNQAMSYFIGENDVSVLLQRYLPPNHGVRSLKFLPETVDNRVCVEARSYTRLLVATEKHAFLYYFLSEEVDSTRKKMSKKVLGKGERTKSRGMHKPIKVGKVIMGQSRDSFTSLDEDEDDTEAEGSTESGRVVMHYNFTSPVSCITANSSFLFVATLSGLQVWSIWSPCHYVAASRALSKALVPQPSQPQLLCTQPIPYPASQIAALDSYVILLPQMSSIARQQPKDLVRIASKVAAERLPEAEFEMRRPLQLQHERSQRSILIFQQSPPSLVFSYVRQGVLSTGGEMKPYQIDLLLSLFSLYRYRADVGFDLLRLSVGNDAARGEAAIALSDRKERMSLELETKLYDRLARECAAELAAIFMSEHHRNLERAALLYVASNVPSIEVMRRLQAIIGTVDRSEVIGATGKYLEAFVFPPPGPLGTMRSPELIQAMNANDENFTRTVLLHYDKYFPEQLSRLVIDSSLKWTLEDSAFALEKLEESTSHSVLVKVARLVLILRAASLPTTDWDSFKAAEGEGSSVGAFVDQCSYASMSALVQDLLQNHMDALVCLTVTHPNLLIHEIDVSEAEDRTPGFCQRFASSILTEALMEKAPLKFLKILERIFSSALGRQETIQSTLLFCLNAIGDEAAPSAARIALSASAGAEMPAATPFVPGQVFVLRFLVFVLRMFPTLEKLVEKEELQDDEEDLQHAKAVVAMELTRLCVKLSSCFQISGSNDEGGRVEATLYGLFQSVASESTSHGVLPDWVQQYLKTRCLPAVPHLKKILSFLFYQALELLHEKDLIRPQDVLTTYGATTPTSPEEDDSNVATWDLENDLAALVVLLTLPRVSRYALGMGLLVGFSNC